MVADETPAGFAAALANAASAAAGRETNRAPAVAADEVMRDLR